MIGSLIPIVGGIFIGILIIGIIDQHWQNNILSNRQNKFDNLEKKVISTMSAYYKQSARDKTFFIGEIEKLYDKIQELEKNQ